MPLPLILGGLLAAIDAAPKLFGAAQAVIETVSGKPSTATSIEGLKAEITALPPEQQTKVLELMQLEISKYEKETERLEVEEGRLTPEMLDAVPPEARAKVALLRMTTRPKIALMAMRVIMLPFYIVLLDGASVILEYICSLFGVKTAVPRLAFMMVDEKLPYAQLYDMAAWPCTTIVITFMTLRSVFDKPKEGTGKGLADQIGSIASTVTGLRGLFSKKK